MIADSLMKQILIHINGKQKVKGTFFGKLIRNNTGYSSKNFMVVCVSIVGVGLLAVPIFILVIEAWYNHTITTNLADMGVYIGAVAAMFTSVGLTKIWGDKYETKDNGSNPPTNNDDPNAVLNVDDDKFEEIAQSIKKILNDDKK